MKQYIIPIVSSIRLSYCLWVLLWIWPIRSPRKAKSGHCHKVYRKSWSLHLIDSWASRWTYRLCKYRATIYILNVIARQWGRSLARSYHIIRRIISILLQMMPVIDGKVCQNVWFSIIPPLPTILRYQPSQTVIKLVFEFSISSLITMWSIRNERYTILDLKNVEV